jgi:hypothetical protein
MRQYELTFSQVVFLIRVPETAMGCHDVVLAMRNNTTKKTKVFNCNMIESSTHIDVNDILRITVNNMIWTNKNK